TRQRTAVWVFKNLTSRADQSLRPITITFSAPSVGGRPTNRRFLSARFVNPLKARSPVAKIAAWITGTERAMPSRRRNVNSTAAVIRSPAITAFRKFRRSPAEIYRGIVLLTRKRRKAISDAIIETSAKLSAVNIPAAETKSTLRRYRAAKGDV